MMPRRPPAVDGLEPSDRDLLAAHVAGDPGAFGELFRRHRDRLWAVALRTTGDPEEAADALQDALVSAFRRAETYRGEAEVTTWLHRVVVNACLDRLRRQRSRAVELTGGSEFPGVEDVPASAQEADQGRARASTDPVHVMLDDERRRAVLAALELLPVDQKAALVLVDMYGYPVEEAAAILDAPTGTVKSRCSRGRAKLALLLPDLRPGNPSGGRSVQEAMDIERGRG